MAGIRGRLAQILVAAAERLDPSVNKPSVQQMVVHPPAVTYHVPVERAEFDQQLSALHTANRELFVAFQRADHAYSLCLPLVALLPEARQTELKAQLRLLFNGAKPDVA